MLLRIPEDEVREYVEAIVNDDSMTHTEKLETISELLAETSISKLDIEKYLLEILHNSENIVIKPVSNTSDISLARLALDLSIPEDDSNSTKPKNDVASKDFILKYSHELDEQSDDSSPEIDNIAQLNRQRIKDFTRHKHFQICISHSRPCINQ